MDQRRKKVSEIWSFFEVINKDIALCKLCKSKLSYKGSSSNLKKHVQRKHPTVKLPSQIETDVNIDEDTPVIIVPSGSNHNDITPMQTGIEPIAGPSNQVTPLTPSPSQNSSSAVVGTTQLFSIAKTRQSTLASFVPKKMTPNDKNKIDSAMMKLFSWDFQPFSVVEDRGFLHLLNVVAPSYKVPSRKYFSNSLLPALYEETRVNLKHTLSEEAVSVCLTTDGWTSTKSDSFLAVTGHYINSNFEMKSVLLDCSEFDEAHTSQNLANSISNTISEWGLNNKIAMVISDNASNITGAVNVLRLKHYGCYAHKLNLVVQGSLNPVENTIRKIKKIVTHFKRSTKAVTMLVKYQEQLGISQPKRLLQDVVTRWNSTFFMVERFVLLEEAIKHCLALLDNIDVVPLTSDEWEISKELCALLEPFMEVTKEMSSEKYLNGSKIIPITRGLKAVVDKVRLTLLKEEVQLVAISLKEGLDKRFANLEKSKSFMLCTFLDPRYKHHMFEDESTTDTAKQHVIRLVSGLITQSLEKASQVEDDDEPVDDVQQNKKLSVWDCYKETMKKVKPKGTSTSMAIIEVQRYMDTSPIKQKDDPLEWWKNHQHVFPNLASVVKQNCCILATSVPCERVFSKTGYILSERRTRLTSAKVKQLVFLNVNLHQ